MLNRRLLTAVVLSGLFASTASAKVLFTGYADLRVVPQSDLKVDASDALISTLPGRQTKRRSEARGFTADSLGIFASTTFTDEADFLMDITYRKVGSTVGETRLQYAYVHYHTASLWEINAGRVTLPIGLYNQEHFYPFQRYTVTPPSYQSSIIGLPIADHGAIASKTFDAGPVGFYASAYLVNGYGPAKDATGKISTDTFRASVNAGDALLISNNLRDTNGNSKFAYGGNFRIMFPTERNVKLGVSSYQGAWSANGRSQFTMRNVYLSVDIGRLNVLTEGLRSDTDNDAGVFASFGSRDWKSTGGFLEANFRLTDAPNELVLFAATEETVAQGKGVGAVERERLVQNKAGLSRRINPFTLVKFQVSQLGYILPLQLPASAGGGRERINIRQRQALLSLVLTY